MSGGSWWGWWARRRKTSQALALRSMAAATGMSQSAVSRIWRAFGLKPHLVQTWKLSTDPQFIEKVRDIVGLYLDPPEKGLVLAPSFVATSRHQDPGTSWAMRSSTWPRAIRSPSVSSTAWVTWRAAAPSRPSRVATRPQNVEVPVLRLCHERLKGLRKAGREVRDRFAAGRVAKRGEHPARMQQRRLDVGVLALCHPRQELVNAEGLGVGVRVDPGRQLGRQLPQDVSRLAAREALGQRLHVDCTARSAASWPTSPAACRTTSMISS